MSSPARFSGMTIRARFALWYAGSVLLTFLVFALALRGTVRTAMRNEFTSAVRSSSDAVRSFFRLEYAEYRDANATITHIANETVFPDRIVEFVRPDGAIAYRVGLDRKAPRSPGAVSEPAASLRAPVRRIVTPLDSSVAPGWSLRVYASAAPLEESLASIDRWLMVGIPLGLVFAGGIGWWLAGRTLRPVGAMAAAATEMATGRAVAGAGAGATNANAARLPIDNPSDELGRLGLRFNALLDQLDGVLGQQRRFLADAAHELRTPVARMLGTVDLASLDPTDATAQRAALVRVRTDLDRTTVLIDELLQLARADADGRVHLVPGYVDDVAVDSVQAWQPIAGQKGVKLLIRTLDEAAASIDPVHLDRLIGVLIDNAIRYTPAGGEIDVSVGMSNGMAELTVSDTGVGIPPDEHTRIFERFFRGTGARKMSPDGSGLGLPIARWIAEAHHATLDLTARAHGGTVATVRFPRVQAFIAPTTQADES